MTLMAVSSQSEKAAHVLYAEAEHRSEGTSAAALADFSTCRLKAQQGAACAERLATMATPAVWGSVFLHTLDDGAARNEQPVPVRYG